MKTYSISEAKQRLGALADEALRGELVMIIRKTRRLVLQEVQEMEPIPLRPEGYFNESHSKEKAALDNRMAKRSIRRVVK